MTVSPATLALGYAGAILVALGVVAAVALMVADPSSRLRRRWADYVAALESEVRFLLLKTSGRQIALAQVAAIAATIVVAAVIGDFVVLASIVPIAIAPLAWLRHRHSERVRELEQALDSWLLMLANALKASPSLGEAVQSSARLVRAPFSQELDLVLKEMKLGTPLDQAVLNMSLRVRSRVVSSSLATILVARQTGGDLPQILEQSAATLREMARLEGVVRTKTAEAKMQAIVLAAIPFVLLFAIHQVDRSWLRPLFETAAGHLVLVVASVLWAAAIFLARRILQVDI